MSGVDHGTFDRLLASWAEAIVANDPEAIGSFAEPDWLLVGEGGIFPRSQFLQSVAAGRLTHDSMSFEVHEVRSFGDLAVVVVRGRNTGTYDGTRFELDEWTTDIFVHRDVGWKCVLTHLTSAVDQSQDDRTLKGTRQRE